MNIRLRRGMRRRLDDHCERLRWLTGRADSPWYPTARLFRQDRTGDWAPVIAALAMALDEFSASAAAG